MIRVLAAVAVSTLLAVALIAFGLYVPPLMNPYPAGPISTPTTYGPPPR